MDSLSSHPVIFGFFIDGQMQSLPTMIRIYQMQIAHGVIISERIQHTQLSHRFQQIAIQEEKPLMEVTGNARKEGDDGILLRLDCSEGAAGMMSGMLKLIVW